MRSWLIPEPFISCKCEREARIGRALFYYRRDDKSRETNQIGTTMIAPASR